jgi:hypothetical protein
MTAVRKTSTNPDLRLPTWSPLLLSFVSGLLLVPGEALGKGGTELHEKASYASMAGRVPNFQLRLPNETFQGCGRGRYLDAHNHKCRGPGDFGH